VLQALVCCPCKMEPASRPNFQLAGAGGTLLGTTLALVVLGALAGWALGSVGLGILAGAFLGIPAGIVAVYRRYRGVV
jgi:F0F1-type ATP synthase assembly protein I